MARPLDPAVRVDVSPGPGWAPLDFKSDWSAVAREFGDRAALTLRVGLPVSEAIDEALALGAIAQRGGNARAYVLAGRTKIVANGLGSLLQVRRNDNVPGFPPGFFANAARAEGFARAIDVVVTPNQLFPGDDRPAYAEITRTTTFPTRRGPYQQSFTTRESVIGGVHVVESTQRDRPPGSTEALVTSISRQQVPPHVTEGSIAVGAR